MLFTAEVTIMSTIKFRVELVKLKLEPPVSTKDGWLTFNVPLLGSLGIRFVTQA